MKLWLWRARKYFLWREHLVECDKKRALQNMRRRLGLPYQLLPRRDWQVRTK